MKLRSLRLTGFKTFADKTEIEFHEGITAVVGPNGCGKSNIADAILWALGEQNPRLLRGDETRDFVFAGAERRKPLGMAEVQILVDNGEGRLPIDFTEVAIARRIYRSGESRYSINGSQCRLKDIVDLFLDTGMGRGAYSFITQSEVDAVLSARPEDRRELIEEAAGVQKYRTRKREAVRKLESAETNLTRIHDIIAELDHQREPLRDQAAVAERYLAAVERLRSIEVDLLISEVHRADYEIYAVRNDREGYIETIRALDAQTAELERDSARSQDEYDAADRAYDSAALAHQTASAELERIQHELRLNLERAQNATAAAERIDADLQALAQKETALHDTLRREESAHNRAVVALESTAANLERAIDVHRSLEETSESAAAAARDHMAAQRELIAERTGREAALAACRARIDESGRRLAELDEVLKDEKALVSSAADRVVQLGQALEGADQAADMAQQAQAGAQETHRAAADDLERCEARLGAAHRRAVERKSRLETLRDMHDAGEGLFQGVRAVLAGAASSDIHGRYRPVADVLRVPERLRIALDVALGSAAQNIICTDAGEARRAIEWLKAGRRGRATFLPLDSLEPPEPLSASAVRGRHGILGIASELVEVEPEYQRAINVLLNRTVIAEDLDAAWALARQVRGWSRIVTLEGELITPGGAVSGGSLSGRGARLVSRKGEMDDLTRELRDIEKEIHQLEISVKEARTVAETAQTTARDAYDLAARRAAERTTAAQALETGRREEAQIRARFADTMAHKARVAETLAQVTAEANAWEQALAEHGAQDIALDETLTRARTEAEAAAQRVTKAREAVTALEIEHSRLKEQVRGFGKSLASLRVSIAETRAERRSRQDQREGLGRTSLDSEARVEALSHSRTLAEGALQAAAAEHERWRRERSRTREASVQTAEAIRSAASRRGATMKSLHDADLKLARLEIQLGQAAQRLTDEYSVTLEEALATVEPPKVDRDTTHEIGRLRREIKAMGLVNTGAVEEFARLTERFDFLAHQRTDLESASASLRETISEIDRSTRDVFMATLEAVRTEFQRLLVRLFGGGKAELSLTRPDNILETGIEISVQLPGKRAQNLALLSGGERALTAVALLFSLLAIRPSPFVLLDEVDAPLDGPNVEKFIELVKDFAKETQFVIITHNPATMESAPYWYGVTMPEPGVSRVISYKPRSESSNNGHSPTDTVLGEPNA